LEKDIYLIVDNAYGAPFPNILFQPTKTVWNERTVHAFSLSKLGLPATRTGIVVGPKEIIQRLGAMNAVMALASTSMGQALTEPLFANDEVLRLSQEVIQPYYARCREHAQDCLSRSIPDHIDYHVHEPEGAFFLWLWLRGSPSTRVSCTKGSSVETCWSCPAIISIPATMSLGNTRKNAFASPTCRNPKRSSEASRSWAKK